MSLEDVLRKVKDDEQQRLIRPKAPEPQNAKLEVKTHPIWEPFFYWMTTCMESGCAVPIAIILSQLCRSFRESLYQKPIRIRLIKGLDSNNLDYDSDDDDDDNRIDSYDLELLQWLGVSLNALSCQFSITKMHMKLTDDLFPTVTLHSILTVIAATEAGKQLKCLDFSNSEHAFGTLRLSQAVLHDICTSFESLDTLSLSNTDIGTYDMYAITELVQCTKLTTLDLRETMLVSKDIQELRKQQHKGLTLLVGSQTLDY